MVNAQRLVIAQRTVSGEPHEATRLHSGVCKGHRLCAFVERPISSAVAPSRGIGGRAGIGSNIADDRGVVRARGIAIIGHHRGQHVDRFYVHKLTEHPVNQDQIRAIRGHLTLFHDHRPLDLGKPAGHLQKPRTPARASDRGSETQTKAKGALGSTSVEDQANFKPRAFQARRSTAKRERKKAGTISCRPSCLCKTSDRDQKIRSSASRAGAPSMSTLKSDAPSPSMSR